MKGTKTTNKPSKYAMGYITPAANALQGTYQANQGQAQGMANELYGMFPDFAKMATEQSPLIGAANTHATDILGGKYLGEGNPYLDQMIQQTGNSVSDRVNALFSKSGRTGSDTNIGSLTKNLADSENSLRYQDSANERQAMMSALGLAPQLDAQKYAGIAPLLGLAQGAAELPYAGVNNYARGIAGLVGNSQTQTSSPSTGSQIASGLGTALQVAGLFSDRRLKTDIEPLGTLADGLGIYRYRYIWDDEPRVGVMADEVARLRPWALGASIDGYATVHYDALEARP
jgi:hypothetical protein